LEVRGGDGALEGGTAAWLEGAALLEVGCADRPVPEGRVLCGVQLALGVDGADLDARGAGDAVGPSVEGAVAAVQADGGHVA
jgi:hypothetical protein